MSFENPKFRRSWDVKFPGSMLLDPGVPSLPLESCPDPYVNQLTALSTGNTMQIGDTGTVVTPHILPLLKLYPGMSQYILDYTLGYILRDPRIYTSLP